MMRKNTVKAKHVCNAYGSESWDLTVSPEFYKDWEDDKLLFSVDGPYRPVGCFSNYFVDANPICHMFADKERILNSGEFIDLGNGRYESVNAIYDDHKLELWTKKACFHIDSHFLPRSGNYRMRMGVLSGRRNH